MWILSSDKSSDVSAINFNYYYSSLCRYCFVSGLHLFKHCKIIVFPFIDFLSKFISLVQLSQSVLTPRIWRCFFFFRCCIRAVEKFIVIRIFGNFIWMFDVYIKLYPLPCSVRSQNKFIIHCSSFKWKVKQHTYLRVIWFNCSWWNSLFVSKCHFDETFSGLAFILFVRCTQYVFCSC